MHRRNLFQNKKGIDQIIAALLMVVIVVVASVMVFVYSTGLFTALTVAPKTATENISLEYAYFSSPNNVTLNIRNDGSTPITLKSYYVKDYAGDEYSRINWATGPNSQTGPFSPKQLDPVPPVVVISSACGASCTYAGTAFTFVRGNTYTVVLVTAINTQFSLQIIR